MGAPSWVTRASQHQVCLACSWARLPANTACTNQDRPPQHPPLTGSAAARNPHSSREPDLWSRVEARYCQCLGQTLKRPQVAPQPARFRAQQDKRGARAVGKRSLQEPRGGRHKAEVKAEGPRDPWNAGQARSPAGEPGMGLLPSEGQQRGFFFHLVLKFQTPASLLRP